MGVFDGNGQHNIRLIQIIGRHRQRTYIFNSLLGLVCFLVARWSLSNGLVGGGGGWNFLKTVSDYLKNENKIEIISAQCISYPQIS